MESTRYAGRSLAQMPPAVLRTDSHVHLLPPVRQFFEGLGLLTCCDGHNVAPALYPDDPHASLQRMFLELSPLNKTSHYSPTHPLYLWTLPYSHKPDMSTALNSAVVELSATLSRDQMWNGWICVVPGFTVHAGDTNPLPEVVAMTALRRGGRVLKLHVSVGDYVVTDDRLEPVWKLAEQVGFPTVIHAGCSATGHTDEDDMAHIAEIARRYPKAKIVLAHFGHTSEEHALTLAAYPNIYFDVTPILADQVRIPPSAYATCLDLAKQGRILFGSDMPNVSVHILELVESVRRWCWKASEHVGGDGWEARAKTAWDTVLGRAADQLLDSIDLTTLQRLPSML